jgi:hypothetical protein
MRVSSDNPLNPVTAYLAHVRRNDDGSFAIHELEEHLRAVGDRVCECLLACLGNIEHIIQ